MTPDTIPQSVLFPDLFDKPLVATFNQEHASSDGGAVLLKAAERVYGLVKAFARCLADKRAPGKIRHTLADLIGQRVFGIACGHPDGNDADHLADDPVFRAGRLPHHSFRGLRSVHIVAARVVAEPPKAALVVGVLQPMSLPPSSAPTATGWSDSCRAGFAPAEEWRLSRRTRSPVIGPCPGEGGPPGSTPRLHPAAVLLP